MIFEPSNANILLASQALSRGELVAFPTETVYGLGAHALDPVAIAKIFALKGRPAFNPLIVHIASVAQLEHITAIPSQGLVRTRLERLQALWPGPLTVLLPKSSAIPDSITAGLPLVGVRIPRHPVALKLLTACNFPVAAPSANKSFRLSPTLASHVEDEFGTKLMILDGAACEIGLESTVVSVNEDSPLILRPGAITQEQLESVLEERVMVQTRSVPPDTEPTKTEPKNTDSSSIQAQPSPGSLALHYAPRTPLSFLSEVPQAEWPPRVALVLFDDAAKEAAHGLLNDKRLHHISILSPTGDLDEAARTLFSVLRQLDKQDLDGILVGPIPESGIGLAVMDRLRRARHS